MTNWSIMVKVVKALWLHEIGRASLFLLAGGAEIVNTQDCDQDRYLTNQVTYTDTDYLLMEFL